jgi:hypothetical protein
MLSFFLKFSPPDGDLQLLRTRLKPLSSWVSFSVGLPKAIVNSNFLSLFSRFNFQEKFWIIVSRHLVLVFGVPTAHQARFDLSPLDYKYPALTAFADKSSAVDAYAESRAEYVSPNLTTPPSPESLAGGPCSRDAIMGLGVVSLTLSLARDLEEALFHYMGLDSSCINDANFDACGQILLVTIVGVFLVASAAGATGRLPCSGTSEPMNLQVVGHPLLLLLC